MRLIEDEISRRGIRLRGRGPERYGPCPVCGGTDRFAINLKKQLWNCRGCAKGGDVIALAMHIDGVNFRAACAMVGELVQLAPVSEVGHRTDKPANATHASLLPTNGRDGLELWRSAQSIVGTPAEIYLRRRLLDFSDATGRVLRFHPNCPFGPAGARPCMVALFRSITTDEPVGIHRTAFDAEGRKIGRMALGRVGGAAIKLTANDEIEHGLTIGEGIETTIAGMMMGFRPAWALGFAGAIRAFPVLAGVDALTILVDHDTPDRNGRQAGPEAACECSDRWVAADRDVRRVVPKTVGADMANLLGAA